MACKNYSNTKIFENNTRKKRTEEKNAELNAMYEAFYKSMEEKARNSDIKPDGYNGVQLLTCFDSYINAKHKIMVYGKEAHTKDGQLIEKSDCYQQDGYYRYDYAIAHRDDKNSDIPKSDCRETQYLKTRRVISGIKKDGKDANKAEELEAKVLSILNNNLNKSSVNGNYTPCNGDIDKLYDTFTYEYNGKKSEKRNIYWHEINILRPTHLLFISGKGYERHIKRDFSDEFYKKIIKRMIKELKIKERPTSKVVELGEEDIKDYFGIKDYFADEEYFNTYKCKKMKIIYAYHPSARLNSDTREKYLDNLDIWKIQKKGNHK